MNGKGTFTSSDGAKYEGDWKDGSPFSQIYPGDNEYSELDQNFLAAFSGK